jgi:hypothetical protein
MTASVTIVILCVALLVLALRLRDMSARLADVARRADDLTARHGHALQDLRAEMTRLMDAALRHRCDTVNLDAVVDRGVIAVRQSADALSIAEHARADVDALRKRLDADVSRVGDALRDVRALAARRRS